MMSELRKARLLRGKSQYDLVLETGLHQATISRIENGYEKPTEEKKRLLALSLKVKVSDIFPEG